MTGMQLAHPYWLFLLAPLAGLAIWPMLRRQRQPSTLFSSVDLVKGLPTTWAQRVKPALPWARTAGLALLIVALARPRQGEEEFRVRTDGIAIEMCIDKSGSMQALDFHLGGERVNRLAAVKKVFRDFVAGDESLAGRPDDLVGLIAFGGYAESMCPLTLDHDSLLEALDQVEIPKPVVDRRGRVINDRLMQEEMATAIGDAVALGVDRLKSSPAKSKVLILLSDGESNAGAVSPEDAAKAAKDFGVKIYSIGIGSSDRRVPFPRLDVFGRETIGYEVMPIDEETLRRIAETTGGKYFHANDTHSLKDVYAEIDELEKTITEGRVYTQYHELFPCLLLPGLALVLLEVVASATRFRMMP